jgi:phosphatidylglycerol lysyltransferase
MRTTARAERLPAPAGSFDGGVPALSVRVAHARRRLVPTALVAVTGLLAVLTALFPAAMVELVELSSSPGHRGLLASRSILVELGVLMLLTGRLLARGSRAAWTVATLAGSAVVLTELLRERLGMATLAAAVTVLSLLATRSAFPLRFSPGRSIRRLLLPLALLGALLVYSLAAYAELDVLHAKTFGARLSSVLRAGVGATGGIDADHPAVEAYVWSLRIGLAVVALSALWALRRRRARQDAGTAEARALAERYGRSSSAPLIALPDNARLPLCGGQGLAGIAVHNGVAISLGLPVVPEGLETRALADFVVACEAAGWKPALLALDERQRELSAGAGFASVKIGEEAFLDVAEFSTAGKRRANVRHSVTRARKDGVTVVRYDEPARSARRDQQLAGISTAWLAGKGGPELGFTLGRFDLDRLGDQEVYAAVIGEGTADERVVGFVTWLPYAAGDAAVLDLMRRDEPCPPGVMECLIVDSLADFARRGRGTASLGGVPLAATTARTDRTQQLMGWLYEHGGPVYAAKGLFRFKDKFAPRWEAMYLAYPAAMDLPRIVLAALRAFLPPGVVRELLSRQQPPPVRTSSRRLPASDERSRAQAPVRTRLGS